MLRDGRVVAARVHIYRGEPEEYQTFVTPEAYSAVKEWMDLRQEYGEKITANSWVMRDIFKTATLTYGAHVGMACAPKQLKSSGIRNMLKRAWISQHLMKEKVDGKSYEFKSSHGFRKRFETQCELAGVKPLNIECMLGHDTGIAGSSYYRPTESEMLNDFLKAVDALTIGEEGRLRKQLQEVTAKVPDLKEIDEKHRREMEAMRSEFERKFQMILEKIDTTRLS